MPEMTAGWTPALSAARYVGPNIHATSGSLGLRTEVGDGDGIRGMRERALSIGASLAVTDRACGGTRVALELELVGAVHDRHGHLSAGTRVLRGVLNGLERAEVDRGLHRGTDTPDVFGNDADRDRRRGRKRTE